MSDEGEEMSWFERKLEQIEYCWWWEERGNLKWVPSYITIYAVQGLFPEKFSKPLSLDREDLKLNIYWKLFNIVIWFRANLQPSEICFIICITWHFGAILR